MSIPFGIHKQMLSAVSAAVLIAVTLPIAACGSSPSPSSAAVGGSEAPSGGSEAPSGGSEAPSGGSEAPSGGSEAPSGSSTAGITDCNNHTVVQPTSLVLACGDGSVSASDLVWQDWGQATTTAHGTISVKLCDPNCAASTKTLTAQGTVTASRLQVCPDGQQRYTRLTYDYNGNQAGPVTMTDTCPFQP